MIINVGLIVTKDISPNTVAVGVPAKVIKTIDEYREGIEKHILGIKDIARHKKRKILLSKHYV